VDGLPAKFLVSVSIFTNKLNVISGSKLNYWLFVPEADVVGLESNRAVEASGRPVLAIDGQLCNSQAFVFKMRESGEENVFTDSPAPIIRVNANHEDTPDSLVGGRTCPMLRSRPAIANGFIFLTGKEYIFGGGVADTDAIPYFLLSVGVESPGASE